MHKLPNNNMSVSIRNIHSQRVCNGKHNKIKDIKELSRVANRITSATSDKMVDMSKELKCIDMSINKISNSFNNLTLI